MYSLGSDLNKRKAKKKKQEQQKMRKEEEEEKNDKLISPVMWNRVLRDLSSILFDINKFIEENQNNHDLSISHFILKFGNRFL